MLAYFTNRLNLFDLVLTINLVIFLTEFLGLLGLGLGLVFIASYCGSISEYHINWNSFDYKSIFNKINLENDYLSAKALDLSLNLNTPNFYFHKSFNILDLFSKFQFTDAILNPIENSNFPSYFQESTIKYNFNKASWIKSFKFNLQILPAEYIPLPLETVEEALFLRGDPCQIALPRETSEEILFLRDDFPPTVLPAVEEIQDLSYDSIYSTLPLMPRLLHTAIADLVFIHFEFGWQYKMSLELTDWVALDLFNNTIMGHIPNPVVSNHFNALDQVFTTSLLADREIIDIMRGPSELYNIYHAIRDHNYDIMVEWGLDAYDPEDEDPRSHAWNSS